MATTVQQQLKKNVIDEVQYHNKPLALAMLTVFLWGPFVACTLILFYLTRHPDVPSPYHMSEAHRELIQKQLIDFGHDKDEEGLDVD